MVRSVLIGKGRRVTLDELQAIAFGDGVVVSTTGEKGDLSATLSSMSLNDSTATEVQKLSTPTTLAALTLLALNVSQNRILKDTCKMEAALCELISQKKDIQLPSDPAAFQNSLPKEIGQLPIHLIQRTIALASGSLFAARALSLANVSTAIAALSVERYGCSSGGHYSEFLFDTNRPHRGLVTSAATLRSILNGSKAPSSTDKEVPVAISTIPQYHGPAIDALKASVKTLELEINCFEIDQELDNTVGRLAIHQALQAVQTLLNGSQNRCAVTTTSPTAEEKDLETLVQQLEAALQQEAKTGVTFVEEATTKSAEEAKKKEAEKAAKQQPTAAKTKDDEFEGMTEAQKAKILKKRAEKEAKAAKKKAQKANKGVALFGSGTQPVCAVLKENNFELSETTITQLQQAMDKLLSGGVQRKPKIPKGTRDYLPEQMMIRQQAFSIIRRVFESHGAVEIDTPVFELKDTLTGKYGEDSKLIYDLADQGGELLALRYDLTVPFARFLALNSVGNIKRFHIGKVYRRDQPALARGRYREFYQCDFDIAGTYGRMVPDSECLCVACDILDSLPIGDFGIKLNHRRLLDAILDLCGVPADKFRTICSAVDKLDKEPWEEVKREMVEDKGLESEVADKIGTFVLQKGAPKEMYKQLMDSQKFGKHAGALDAMEDLRILFEYLDAMDKLKFISFDLSLARGLDYYTGVIYEAVCMNGNTQVGSIGGGGRYDTLVSMFQEAGKVTPCVGVSVGIERVFTLMEARLREENAGSIKQPNVNVLVASVGAGMMKERMKITRVLWDANISAEFSQQENPKLKYELANALERGIPFMVIVGEEEVKENKCKVKDLTARTEETVSMDDLVKILRGKGVVPVGCEFAAELLKKEKAEEEASS